jgi:putative SOS response-associated peptidase YedK
MSDERPFAFAGLWEYWEGGDGEVIESGTILTTSANEVVQPFHDRMPVILDSVHFERWLNTEGNPASEVQELLVPYAGTDLVANAVDGPIREVKSKPSDVQGHFAWET